MYFDKNNLFGLNMNNSRQESVLLDENNQSNFFNSRKNSHIFGSRKDSINHDLLNLSLLDGDSFLNIPKKDSSFNVNNLDFENPNDNLLNDFDDKSKNKQFSFENNLLDNSSDSKAKNDNFILKELNGKYIFLF